MTIPLRVGCPIRTSTDQCLLAAPRGFSQRATSFIASWCQGIHRMPFLRSRSPDRRLAAPSCPPCPGAIPTGDSRWHDKPLSTSLVSELSPRRGSVLRHCGQTCDEARPETHQNLIYPDKEQEAPGRIGRTPRRNPADPMRARTQFRRNACFLSRRHAGRPTGTPGDKLLVEVIGFEPTTPCLQSRCSPS